jgi:hypothetical protein
MKYHQHIRKYPCTSIHDVISWGIESAGLVWNAFQLDQLTQQASTRYCGFSQTHSLDGRTPSFVPKMFGRTPPISGSRPWIIHTAGFYRESAASAC